MRKQIARLTLALALASAFSSCGQTAAQLPSGVPGGNHNGSTGGAGRVPAELVGTWLNTTAGDTIYTAPGGATSGVSGTGVQFAFTAQGTYTSDVYENVALYGCNTGYSGHVEGTASLVGSQIVLKATKAVLRSWGCSGEHPSKDLSNDRDFLRSVSYTFNYEISPDSYAGGRRLLHLTLPDESEFQTLRSH